jgi:hypothetical protein
MRYLRFNKKTSMLEHNEKYLSAEADSLEEDRFGVSRSRAS